MDKQCIQEEMEYREWREAPQWYCVKTTYHLSTGKMESEIVADEKTNLAIVIQQVEKPSKGVLPENELADEILAVVACLSVVNTVLKPLPPDTLAVSQLWQGVLRLFCQLCRNSEQNSRRGGHFLSPTSSARSSSMVQP